MIQAKENGGAAREQPGTNSYACAIVVVNGLGKLPSSILGGLIRKCPIRRSVFQECVSFYKVICPKGQETNFECINRAGFIATLTIHPSLFLNTLFPMVPRRSIMCSTKGKNAGEAINDSWVAGQSIPFNRWHTKVKDAK